MESVDIAKKRFLNIKKRFNNRRKKRVGPSGSGSKDAQEGKEQFQDMAYLSWLEPHVQDTGCNIRCAIFDREIFLLSKIFSSAFV